MPCSLLCDSCSGARIWCQHDSCSQTSQNMMTFGLFSNYIMAGHIVESILTVHPEETWENYRKLGKHFHEQLTESSSPDNFSGAGRWRSKNNLCRQFQLSLANPSPEGESNLSWRVGDGQAWEWWVTLPRLWKGPGKKMFKGAIILPTNCRATLSRRLLCLF
jgi:hypothetical protein